jgi:FtsP/CotA-like multicopper oxidase with cupredoxin domain
LTYADWWHDHASGIHADGLSGFFIIDPEEGVPVHVTLITAAFSFGRMSRCSANRLQHPTHQQGISIEGGRPSPWSTALVLQTQTRQLFRLLRPVCTCPCSR